MTIFVKNKNTQRHSFSLFLPSSSITLSLLLPLIRSPETLHLRNVSVCLQSAITRVQTPLLSLQRLMGHLRPFTHKAIINSTADRGQRLFKLFDSARSPACSGRKIHIKILKEKVQQITSKEQSVVLSMRAQEHQYGALLWSEPGRLYGSVIEI